MKDSNFNNEQLFATFFMDELEFAIDVRHVRDAIEAPSRIVPLPASPDYLLGIINLRDNIIPIVDTRRRFRMPDSKASDRGYIAITRCKDRYMGLTFNRISEVVRVEKKRMETLAPEFQVEGDLVADVIKMDNGERLIQVINPESMFDFAELPDSILAQMARRDERKETTTWRQILVFSIADELFGVDVDQVREIIMVPEIRQRVRAEKYIKGVIEVRGELIPVIDLRTYLGGDTTPPGSAHRIIILRDDTMPTGVLVDGVREVLRFESADLKPMPPLAGNRHEGAFSGVVKQRGVSVVLLDMEALFGPDRDQIEGHLRIHDDNAAGGAMDVMGRTSAGETDDCRPQTFITFELDTVYGAPIEQIREIVPIGNGIHHLPGQVNFIQGFINLRDEVIPVVNLRHYFSADDNGGGKETLIIIFTVKNRRIGVLIDRLLEIVTLDNETVKDVPQLVARRNEPRFRDMLERIIETKDGNNEPTTTLIIDVSRFVDALCSSSNPIPEEVVEAEEDYENIEEK